MAKKRKQTTKKRKTPKSKEVELVPSTKQDMSDGFDVLAKGATDKKYDKEELSDVYDSYERSIRNWRKLTKKHLGIDLPEPPTLPGNDYYAGMIALAQYCHTSAAKLIEPKGKGKRTMPAPLVEKTFRVTVKTLERWVKDGKLIDYREDNHAKNEPMQLDVDVIVLKFERRK